MVNFSRPPINEVVLSQAFTTRLDFLVPHFGEFWTTIKDRYPKTQHASPMAAGSMLIQDPSGALLPRVWFISEDDTRLIQLQQDRLIANWRQTDKQEEYIRFPPIRQEFEKTWAQFDAFVTERLGASLQPTRLELSYINIILPEPGEQIADLCNRILRDHVWSSGPRFLSKPQRLQLQMEVPLRDEAGLLIIRIGSAQKKSDGSPALRLELSASGSLSEELTRDKWIDIAHDTIVHGFKDLTSPDVQVQEWGLL